MDSKLKALKVVELKAVLAKAAVHVPARATKADLVARILASQPAQDAYQSIYEPPEDTYEQPAPLPAQEEEEPLSPLLDVTPLDPDLEKRKQRAARFGIPVVDAPQPTEDVDKLNARAARFGLEGASLKHSAPTEQVDAEEQERRRKRAERFGLHV